MPKRKRQKFSEEKQSLAVTKLTRQVRFLSKSRELKFHDVGISVAPGTTAQIVQLSGIGQGDTQLTRDGNSIQGVRLQLSYYWAPPATSAIEDWCRVVVVQDKRYSSTAVTAADILERGTSATVNDFKEVNSASRNSVTFLHDKVTRIAPDFPSAHTKISINLKTKPKSMYDGTTGADVAHGNFYLLCMGTDNANPATLTGEARLTFMDA